jgi:outer membrane protein assembly factor BamB
MPQCSYGAGELVCARPGLVYALDPADGAVRWRHPVAATVRGAPPVVAGGLVQPALDTGRRLEALDPGTGRVRWKRTVPAYGAIRYAGGTILLTGTDGTVTGVDAASGDSRWTRRIPGHAMPLFSSFAGDPAAYAVTTSGDGTRTRVTAVDPETGEVRWDARLAGSLKPVGAAGDTVTFVETDPVYGYARAVVRYAPATQAVRRVALPVRLDGAHATVHGDTVYLLAAGGALEAVDLGAGKRRWHLETSVSRGSAPVVAGGHVYLTAADGRLLAVDARGGRLLGETRPRLGAAADRVVAALPAPVAAGGRVYGAAPDGTVFGLDGASPAAW